MKGNLKNIEDFVRNQVHSHEFDYDPGEWNKLENNLKSPKNNFFTRPSFIISSLVAVLSVIAVYYFYDVKKQDNSVKASTIEQRDLITEKTSAPFSELNKENEVITVENVAETHLNKVEGLEKQETTDTKVVLKDSSQDVATIETKIELVECVRTPGAKIPCALFSFDISEGCAPLDISFTPIEKTDSMVYLWDFGDGTSSSGMIGSHKYSVPGTYNVSLTVKYYKTEKVITHKSTRDIVVYPVPKVDFDYDMEEDNVKFFVLSDLNNLYNWNFGDGNKSDELNPTHKFLQKGQYSIVLTAVSQNSCQASKTKTIRIEKEKPFVMPSAFVPDGDGINDFYGPVFRNVEIVQFEMQIFNRQGMLVYQTKDISKPWDGKIMGSNRMAEFGVYVYIVKTVEEDGNITTEQDHFSLLK